MIAAKAGSARLRSAVPAMNTEGIKGHELQIRRLSRLLAAAKVPHALLFSGPQGIGKKMIARRFLAALFCKEKNPPCLGCFVCRQVEAGTFPDYMEILPAEKGNIPIGDGEKKEPGSVRWLIERLSRKSLTGRTGVLIDGVDRISPEGQNAVLKTIEEPSKDTHLVLVTSSRSAVVPTILSRCYEMKFPPLHEGAVREIIADKAPSGEDAGFLAEIAGGSPGIALKMADGGILSLVLATCREISSFLNSGEVFRPDLSPLQKKIGLELFLDIALNIYRWNLLLLLGEKGEYPGWGRRLREEGIFLEEEEKIVYIIKILLALKRGRSNNLNIRNALKGMLYSLYTDSEDIPLLDISSAARELT